MTEGEKIELHERLAKLENQVETLIKLVEKMDGFLGRWKSIGVAFMVMGGGFVFILDHWGNLTKAVTRWALGQ